MLVVKNKNKLGMNNKMVLNKRRYLLKKESSNVKSIA
jgi:hypothetical protein